MTRLPQVLVNVPVAAPMPDAAERFAAEIAAAEAELGDHGRVLVRPSGTEPLVRVMVEAPTQAAGRRRPPTASPRPCAAVDRLVATGSAVERVGSLAADVRHRRHRQPSPHPTGAVARRGARRARRRARRRAVTSRAVTAAAGEVDDAAPRRARPARARRAPELVGRRSRPASTSSTPTPPRSTPRWPPATLDADALERASAELIALRDVLWAIRRDRLRTATAVADLAGRDAGPAALAGYLVDPAGAVGDRPHGGARPRLGRHPRLRLGPRPRRRRPGDRRRGRRARPRPAVPVRRRPPRRALPVGRVQGGGRDRRARRQHPGDARGGRAPTSCCASPCAASGPRSPCSATPAGPASASSPSPTPTPSTATSSSSPAAPTPPFVVGVLNGDVDNHADLRVAHGLRVAGPITTDAKVIPALVARHAAGGVELFEAFRRTVASFEGSVAIGARRRRRARAPVPRPQRQRPGRVRRPRRGPLPRRQRALRRRRGDVALRPPRRRARRAGRRARRRRWPARSRASTRRGYDGSAAAGDRRPTWSTAEVTTRDIDRGDFPHFLLKEITESPDSLAKTLRGKIVERDGLLHAAVGDRALPPDVAARLADGSITRDPGHRPGHGRRRRPVDGRRARRAAPAGRSTSPPITATELSGFGLRRDMSDTLAIAVSQSGTTTDTNRTVDLLRGRGAAVLAIVNRRSSDLTDKADGVLYTSDGRDVEMSVASTKAFYAQVAAGALLACAISEAAGVGTTQRRHELLDRRCASCPTRCARCSAAATSSPTRPAASPRRSATGPSSAAAPTRSPPRRSGSSSASSATSRSPATSSRTRSTSTCRRSR